MYTPIWSRDKHSLIYNLMEHLANAFMFFKDGDESEWSKLEPLVRAILENNGCSITHTNPMKYSAMVGDSYKGPIALYVIKGIQGNKDNEYFDIFEYHGVIYFVVFIDYFSEIKSGTDLVDEEDFEAQSEEILSNSVYFDALTTIVQKFYDIAYGVFDKALYDTAIGRARMYNPFIISAFIINLIRPINPDDTDGCPLDFETLANLINKPDKFEEILAGVKNYDDNV